MIFPAVLFCILIKKPEVKDLNMAIVIKEQLAEYDRIEIPRLSTKFFGSENDKINNFSGDAQFVHEQRQNKIPVLHYYVIEKLRSC